MSTPTKAAAIRWLAARVGMRIDTSQVRSGGAAWLPGPRDLRMIGGVFTLDGSRVMIDRNTNVLVVGDDCLILEWTDEGGNVIHTTTYTES